jgi:hypothetical protein
MSNHRKSGSNLIPCKSLLLVQRFYSHDQITKQTKQAPWSESASELFRLRDRRLSAKLVPTFADRGCRVLSVTDSYGRNLSFLDRSCYFFFQVAPQLYSRGWVDPVPDPLLLRKSGIAGNRTRTYGSLAMNSDHWTTEAVWSDYTVCKCVLFCSARQVISTPCNLESKGVAN